MFLAWSCTPKDRRNRMTWVKPGNGYVLKDPALAAKLKNLPTEIVDSGFKYIIFQTTIDYFLCNASYYCSRSYEKKHGDRQGVVGRAFLIISPVEKAPAMKTIPKQGDDQTTAGRTRNLKDVSIVKISIVLDDYIYLPNPEKCNLRKDGSGDGASFGSIRFITPDGPYWEDWGVKRMAFFVVDFRIGKDLHSVRSEPLPIHVR